jgi:hypothetical protein
MTMCKIYGEVGYEVAPKVCKPLTICTLGEVEVQPPSEVSDRICESNVNGSLDGVVWFTSHVFSLTLSHNVVKDGVFRVGVLGSFTKWNEIVWMKQRNVAEIVDEGIDAPENITFSIETFISHEITEYVFVIRRFDSMAFSFPAVSRFYKPDEIVIDPLNTWTRPRGNNEFSSILHLDRQVFTKCMKNGIIGYGSVDKTCLPITMCDPETEIEITKPTEWTGTF